MRLLWPARPAAAVYRVLHWRPPVLRPEAVVQVDDRLVQEGGQVASNLTTITGETSSLASQNHAATLRLSPPSADNSRATSPHPVPTLLPSHRRRSLVPPCLCTGELAGCGQLHQVGTCADCGIAVDPNQLHCSAECKQRWSMKQLGSLMHETQVSNYERDVEKGRQKRKRQQQQQPPAGRDPAASELDLSHLQQQTSFKFQLEREQAQRKAAHSAEEAAQRDARSHHQQSWQGHLDHQQS